MRVPSGGQPKASPAPRHGCGWEHVPMECACASPRPRATLVASRRRRPTLSRAGVFPARGFARSHATLLLIRSLGEIGHVFLYSVLRVKILSHRERAESSRRRSSPRYTVGIDRARFHVEGATYDGCSTVRILCVPESDRGCGAQRCLRSFARSFWTWPWASERSADGCPHPWHEALSRAERSGRPSSA